MKSGKRSSLALGGMMVASLLAGMLLSSRLDLASLTGAALQQGQEQQSEIVAPGSGTLVEIARRDTPSVVNISTTKIIRGRRSFGHRQRPRMPSPFEDFFGQDDFFERFFGEIPERDLKQQSLGSGFIVDKEGYILTNNHVVENADDIKVTLSDGRSYEAQVKGTDSKTDIALIKIEAENDLPVAVLGDSEKLQVGEWVMAIGNPFGLQQTVTVGVVSAKGRIIGAGPYDNFIQTDASINFGNSGGPLINMQGEVVGINTAIVARGQGIGFAIPVNLARNIMTQLREKGTVVRGWLGVQIQSITPELAESLELDDTKGALIAGVFKDDPADRAGIKVGDVVIEFDGMPVTSDRDLVNQVGNTLVGRNVTVKFLRKGEEMSLEVKIGKRADEEAEIAAGEDGEDLEPFRLGITVQDLDEELAERFGLDEVKGVLVTEVDVGGAADKAGISRGDIILEVDRKEVSDIKGFRAILKDAEADASLLFLVKRGQGNYFLVVKPEKEKE